MAPKLKVPTIYKAYFSRPKFQEISPPNMAKNMLEYLHFNPFQNH